jgi:hypothetical protein
MVIYHVSIIDLWFGDEVESIGYYLRQEKAEDIAKNRLAELRLVHGDDIDTVVNPIEVDEG